MATKDEIFNLIDSLYSEFKENHFKTTRVSKQKARKALVGIKKLVTDYRRASVEESKLEQ